MGTPNDRVEAAVTAAARTFHDMIRERWNPRWENVSARLREEMKAFVRPLVTAALKAADAAEGCPSDANQHPSSISARLADQEGNSSFLQYVTASGMTARATGANRPTSDEVADDISMT